MYNTKKICVFNEILILYFYFVFKMIYQILLTMKNRNMQFD